MEGLLHSEHFSAKLNTTGSLEADFKQFQSFNLYKKPDL